MPCTKCAKHPCHQFLLLGIFQTALLHRYLEGLIVILSILSIAHLEVLLVSAPALEHEGKRLGAVEVASTHTDVHAISGAGEGAVEYDAAEGKLPRAQALRPR